MSDFKVAGIASGFDWTSMVDQLMAIERIPQQRLRTEQTTNSNKVDALNTLGTKLAKLQSTVSAFNSETLFKSKSTNLSNETMGISATAGTGSIGGKFDIDVTQLATASKRIGTSDVGGNAGDENTVLTNLRLASDITEGTFEINGQEITVAGTDTLQDVFDAISAATSGVVTGSYDAVSDTVTLNSATGELSLGSSDDTSNFLSALKLNQMEVVDAGGGTSAVSSRTSLGVVDLNSTIADSGIPGPISGAGTFHINGVAIEFDANTDSVNALMSRVNDSQAGVFMSYDTATDRFRIVNEETGELSMPVIDSGNGVLSAMGLTGSATLGQNLEFSIDGGDTLTSRGNTITAEEHGITDVVITASEEGKQTITIASDTSSLKEQINSFISAYNDVQDYIQEKTKIKVNEDEVEAATLAGNREVSSLDSKLRGLAFGAIEGMSGSLFRLEHLGIDFISGTSKLEIKDSSDLDAALSSDLDQLEQFFMGDDETSFSARMDSFLEDFTSSDGALEIQEETLTSRNKAIDDQIEEMERRIAFQQSALEASFIAMEEAQQNINNQSSALSSLSLSWG